MQPKDPKSVSLGAHIGGQVARLRKSKGIAALAFANETGMSRGTVYKLESGGIENPSLGTLLSIQSALGLASLEELFGALPSRSWLESNRPRP